MGLTTRRGTEIQDFTPDDTEDTFYIDTNFFAPALDDILGRAYEKWGSDINISYLKIEAKYIHTECLGYDRYDPSDYTNYLVVSYTPPKPN